MIVWASLSPCARYDRIINDNSQSVFLNQSASRVLQVVTRPLRVWWYLKCITLNAQPSWKNDQKFDELKLTEMASVTCNHSPQNFISRNRSPIAPSDVNLRKAKNSKDENFPEVPKVIEDGNGKRYFRGRLLGKVREIQL